MISNTDTQRAVLIQASGIGSDLKHKLQTLIQNLGHGLKLVDQTYHADEAHYQTFFLSSPESVFSPDILKKIHELEGVKDCTLLDPTFSIHLGGKIATQNKIEVNTREQLSLAYTPEVAKICVAIHESPEQADIFTIRHNTVAVISDGTAVLGLGDIGPKAALPVMEGKVLLFKEFAGVDAFPICLATKNIDEIIRTITYIAPNFGGINLEDISAPRCFEIEKRLKENLDIPVFHDDQHGTAAVVSAAFINALKLTNRKAKDLKIVFSGVGAAGTACKNMLLQLGAVNIIGCDRKGAIVKSRTDLDPSKREFAESTNPFNETGSLQDVIKGADVFIGLSGPGAINVNDLKNMNKDSIVFAMANPIPEIMPEIAAPYVSIIATGRSDYPNQINNVLAFPGIFRGALDCRARDINPQMQIAAAYAIANSVDEKKLSPDHIIPSVFDRSVVPAVAAAVIKAAIETKVARKI